MILNNKNLLLFSIITVSLISCSSDDDQKSSGGNTMMLAEAREAAYEGNIKNFVERMLEEGQTPNRLINEKSPYLLQHAFNPVNWYPWGEEAFEKARRENKPIFLSIGYSTCYWCHVMEREVFEVPAIAAELNRMFVAIKVDREERPDVDRIYMQALQLMTGGGGWPMSIFMTQDLKPFWGGTYIPPESKYGRLGFVELITRINDIWVTQKDDLIDSADNLYSILISENSRTDASRPLKVEILETGFNLFQNSYDPKYGGFGNSPKFPRASIFNFMLRYAERADSQPAKEMILHTLRKIAEGGIYDHIGGGFHRYSIDERWHVPHFEKMLYDQGQLIVAYLEAYQISGEEFYADIAKDALSYVLRNMTSPGGGFYSAEDAESATDPAHPNEKSEGAFYIWSAEELQEVLGEDATNIFSYYYGVESDGNVRDDPFEEFSGKNVLYRAHTQEEAALNFGISVDELSNQLKKARKMLFEEREERVNPHLDDKILVSWNGYMISAFAKAYQIFSDEEYLTAAKRAVGFIEINLYDARKKTLKRRYRDGEAGITANLADYALLIASLLDLYEASFNVHYLRWAAELNDSMILHFYDESTGAFWDTPENIENLLVRTRDEYDSAEPTGNSVAVMNLLRLSQMLDSQDLREKADSVLAYYAPVIERAPQALPQMLAAYDFSLVKSKQIIIAGNINKEDTRIMISKLHSKYIPNKIVLFADSQNGENFLSDKLPIIKAMKMINGKATAYVCENYACKLPTTDLDVFISLLEEKSIL